MDFSIWKSTGYVKQFEQYDVNFLSNEGGLGSSVLELSTLPEMQDQEVSPGFKLWPGALCAGVILYSHSAFLHLSGKMGWFPRE